MNTYWLIPSKANHQINDPPDDPPPPPTLPGELERIDGGLPAQMRYGGFLKLGYHFGYPHNKDYSILGYILGSPYSWKLITIYVLFLVPGQRVEDHFDGCARAASVPDIGTSWCETCTVILGSRRSS